MSLAEAVKEKALQLGFDLAGITDASPLDGDVCRRIGRWLEAGFAGGMDYMHRNFSRRVNPSELLKGANSVIVVGLNYKPARQEKARQRFVGDFARTADYACYEDYHLFIKRKLRKLAEFLVSSANSTIRFKICVDSVPLAERALAVRAGLGFIGRNHMLINPELGPQILLGEIVTSLKLKTDVAVEQSCGRCADCISACPTGALRADGQFDASRCIGYLTVEYEGIIEKRLAEKIQEQIFGCDRCVLACPYQKAAPVCRNKEFKFYSDRKNPDLHDILAMSQQQFESEFADSCIRRSGLEMLKRNARICLANAVRRF